MSTIRRFGWTAFALIGLAGCEPAAPTPTPPATPSATPETKTPPAEPGKPGAAVEKPKLSDEEIAEIKKLSPEDQKIAFAQVVCPVSGDHLGEGGMGAPIKQVVDGKTFFLCCKGCEDDVKADPKGVLAKLMK
jgi:hypothetical protein